MTTRDAAAAGGGVRRAGDGRGSPAAHPRAVRVSLAAPAAHVGLDPVVVEPLELATRAQLDARDGQEWGASDRLDGGDRAHTLSDPGAPATATGVVRGIDVTDEDPGPDGDEHASTRASLVRLDAVRAMLTVGSPAADERTPVLLMPPAPGRDRRGVEEQEVIVDGWRIVVEVEGEQRASLRERAQRGRDATVRSGPTEVRAIIPGRVVSVSVAAGDTVTAGQQLLVVEAMKMQNELRASRDGTVARVAVGQGQTIEVGDVLLVIE